MSDYKYGERVRVKSGFFGGLVGHVTYESRAYTDTVHYHVKCRTAHGKELLIERRDNIEFVPTGAFADFHDAGLRREIEVLTTVARQYPESYAEALADARTELARRGLA